MKHNAYLRILLWAGLILESIIIMIYGKQYGPVHFSINGLPDGYGNQKFLALLPLTGFLLFLLLNWLKGMKHMLNYPVKITPLNRAKQETLIGGLIDDYSMITLLSFNLLSAYLIYTLTAEQSKEIWVVLLFLILGYTVPFIAYMKKANRYK